MVDYIHLDLFNQGSIRKDISIEYKIEPDIVKYITNNDVVVNTFSLNESAFNSNEFKFGSLVSSKLTFKIFNTVEDRLQDKEIHVREVVNNDVNNLFSFGKYKVKSEQVTADRLYRQIEAYDSLYDIVNLDVADWYEKLSFPMTIKQFRNSFFDHIGLEQVSVSLINDDVIITKTISSSSLSGKTVLSAICEINGSFGRINRDGKFAYITLQVDPEQRIVLNKIVSGTGSYEDYDFEPISKVQIRQTSDDIGAIVGEDGNTYIVQDNFLMYGKNNEELTIVATNLLSKIRGITYKPFKAKFIYGNPCYEIGDAITVISKNATFNSYIFNRTLNGINAITDEITASGPKTITDNINSTQSKFMQLERKTSEVVQSVDGIKATVTETKAIADEALEKAEEAAGGIEVGGVNLVDKSIYMENVLFDDVDIVEDENGMLLSDENENVLYV